MRTSSSAKPTGRLNDSRQTELRFFESIPGGLEIMALGNDRFQCFEAQPVRRFQVADQHLRQSPSPQTTIVAEPRSTSDGRRNHRQKNIGGLGQMIQALRWSPGACFETGGEISLASFRSQRMGLARCIFNLLENRFNLSG